MSADAKFEFRRVASGIRKVHFQNGPGIMGRLLGDLEVCQQIAEVLNYGRNEQPDSRLHRIMEVLVRSEQYSEPVPEATHDTVNEDYGRFMERKRTGSIR